MRKFIRLLLLSLSLMMTNLLQANEGTPIIIRVEPSGGHINRFQEEVPITCYVDTDAGYLVVSFSGSIGNVRIDIDNITTGESSSSVLPGSGTSILYFSGTQGSWIVTFTLSTGEVYYGEFNV